MLTVITSILFCTGQPPNKEKKLKDIRIGKNRSVIFTNDIYNCEHRKMQKYLQINLEICNFSKVAEYSQ